MCHGYACPSDYLYDVPHYVMSFNDFLPKITRRTHDFSKSVRGSHLADPIPVVLHLPPSLLCPSRHRKLMGFDPDSLVVAIYIRSDFSSSLPSSRLYPDGDTCFVIPARSVRYRRVLNNGLSTPYVTFLEAKCTCLPRAIQMTYVCRLNNCDGTTRVLVLPVPVLSKYYYGLSL
jgi:hypothetical protein